MKIKQVLIKALIKLEDKFCGNSMNATLHELSSKTNESRLDSAIEKLKS